MTDLFAQQVTITTSRSLVVPPISAAQQVLITNRDATNSVFVGPSNVTSTSGAEIKPGANWANAFVDLPPETSVYVIAAAGTPRIDVSQVVAD